MDIVNEKSNYDGRGIVKKINFNDGSGGCQNGSTGSGDP